MPIQAYVGASTKRFGRQLNKEHFKNIRLGAGLTQVQLAELLELSSQNLISKYERGERVPSKQTQLLYKLVEEGKLKNTEKRKYT